MKDLPKPGKLYVQCCQLSWINTDSHGGVAIVRVPKNEPILMLSITKSERIQEEFNLTAFFKGKILTATLYKIHFEGLNPVLTEINR